MSEITKRIRITLLATAALAPLALTAPAAAAAQPAPQIPPQENVPTLRPGGPPKTVVYPPNGAQYSSPVKVVVGAPAYTRVTDLQWNGHHVTPQIGKDGRRASITIGSNSWQWKSNIIITLKADADAPYSTDYGIFKFGKNYRQTEVKIGNRLTLPTEPPKEASKNNSNNNSNSVTIINRCR